MEDIRCTNCNQLLGKKMVIRYGEIKCPRCKAINIIDRVDERPVDIRDSIRGLTNDYPKPIMDGRSHSGDGLWTDKEETL